MLSRPLLIAGNWKMNPTSREAAVTLGHKVKVGVGTETSVRVAVCPPSVFLEAVDGLLDGSPIGLGGQNMHWDAEGAYTGELSGPMLIDCGCTHVILGHSERRHGLGETNKDVNKKLHAALKVGLIPIVCVGETLEQREAGHTLEVVAGQIAGSLDNLTAEQVGGLVLAYEPVWAIGTGRVATPEQAQEVHRIVRTRLAMHFEEATAARVTVLYGGSVKADNAGALLSCPDLDGALVGGASLKSEEFLGIIQAARDVTRKGKKIGNPL